MKKTVCVFHNDLDAVGCWTVFKWFDYRFSEVFFKDYSFREDPTFVEHLFTFDEVSFADLSPDQTLLENLLAKGIEVNMWDHHISSEPLKETKHPNFYCVHDLTRSGTRIVYDDISTGKTFNQTLQDFVILVDTYDLWMKDSPLWKNALNMNRWFFSILNWGNQGEDLYSRFFSLCCNKFLKESKWSWNGSDLLIINKVIAVEEAKTKEAIQRLRLRTDSRGYKWGLTFLDRKISIVASTLLEKYPDLDYLVCINVYDGWTGKISVRSSRGFDVTMLLGVNGHVAAGGGNLDPRAAIDLYRKGNELGYKDNKLEDSATLPLLSESDSVFT